MYYRRFPFLRKYLFSSFNIIQYSLKYGTNVEKFSYADSMCHPQKRHKGEKKRDRRIRLWWILLSTSFLEKTALGAHQCLSNKYPIFSIDLSASIASIWDVVETTNMKGWKVFVHVYLNWIHFRGLYTILILRQKACISSKRVYRWDLCWCKYGLI